MKLHALEIPDEPADLAGWLERQLVGLDLALLVAELTAIHGPAPSTGPTVRELLANQYDEVIERGLGVLPSRTIGYFLLRPQLLLELQELVLTAGGPYWDQLLQDAADVDAAMSAGSRRLQSYLDGHLGSAGVPGSGATVSLDAHRSAIERAASPAWYRHPAVVSFATAATVLAGVVLYNQQVTRGPDSAALAAAWGWNRPGAIRDDLPGDRYLDALADAAAEWFDEPVTERVQLARRIGELRLGCSALILADHKPLSPADREWLVERCRVWAGKLEGHLSAAEAGGELALLVEETGATVRGLIDALRARAAELRSA